jgi:hypothetical protein
MPEDELEKSNDRSDFGIIGFLRSEDKSERSTAVDYDRRLDPNPNQRFRFHGKEFRNSERI